MTRILFLSLTTSCRNRMAAAFAAARCPEGVRVLCAGMRIEPVHPLTVQVMDEVGIDIRDQHSLTIPEAGPLTVDMAISLCRDATDECPVLPECPEFIEWAVAPPWLEEGDDATRLAAFRQTRDTIRALVDDFFDRGYFAAFRALRAHERLVLDNVSDGIIAHDLDGRIVSFNKAAERITGYSRRDVLFKNCQDVFPGGRCGGATSRRE